MNRFSATLRQRVLLLVLMLALLLFPLLLIRQQVRKGQSPAQQRARAGEIAAALRAHPQALEGAQSSTEVFQRLISGEFLAENLLFVPGFEPRKRPANDDGILDPEENSWAIATELPGRSAADAPFLILDPGLWEWRREGRWPWGSPRWIEVDGKGRVRMERKRPVLRGADRERKGGSHLLRP